MKKTNKGFTLIELLVVIAIIGILSAVVLASLNTARNKGKDASAKASIESVRAQAEIYYNSQSPISYGPNGTTGNACSDTQTAKLLTAAQNQTANAPICTVAGAGASYTAYDKLNDGTYFCVDSSGFAGDPSGTGAVALPGTYAAGVTCK
jgi:prepilin-type N-terminal cleavage/methylation domain-containing protein